MKADELSDDGNGLEVAVRLADRDFEVQLEVAAGEVLAVLGPNGAGKSTLLDIVSGLVQPDAGYVRLAGRTLTNPAKSLAVPPHRRGMSLLAQVPLLFPHLTVAQNVAFGPRSRGARAGAAKSVAREWLGAVDAIALAERQPSELSGGQAQRVALARALAVDPRLLLMDEPMSALDVAVASAMRALLRRVLRGPVADHHGSEQASGQPPMLRSGREPGSAGLADGPLGATAFGAVRRLRSAVLVTHDIIDALTLADRMVVIESGRVVETGTVATVLARPRSTFAARIAGVNLIVGTAAPGPRAFRDAWSPAEQASAGIVAREPDAAGGAEHPIGTVRAESIEVYGRADGEWVAGGPAAVVFSPTGVAVHRDPPKGSPRNTFRVQIAELSDRGGIIRAHAADRADGSAGLAADLTPAAVADLGLVPGMWVYFAVKAAEIQVYPC